MNMNHMSALFENLINSNTRRFRGIMVKLADLYEADQNPVTDQYVGTTVALSEHDDYQMSGCFTSLPDTNELRLDFIFTKKDVADLMVTWTYEIGNRDTKRLEADWKELPVRIDDVNYLMFAALELEGIVAGMTELPDTTYTIAFPV